MKKILLLLIIMPMISNSQNNDFLTRLFLDSAKFQNQDFKLVLSGVVNRNAYNNKISDILWIKDISSAVQKKSNVWLGGYDPENPDYLKNKCSWNWKKKNENLSMISPNNLDYFPSFSFLKGKLLTIIDADSTNKDYLFSVTKSVDYDNYGHKSMSFNLTDEDEKGYKINTIIFDDEVYIELTTSEMQKLGFQSKFTNYVKFKLLCKDDETYNYSYSYASRYLKGEYESYKHIYEDYLQNCSCVCDANYITLYKNKTPFMKKDYTLNPENLYYLFKFVQKK